MIDFSDGFVKIALEKTHIPVTFSNLLVTFEVRTGCSLVPYYQRLRDLVYKPYRVLSSAHMQPESTKIIEWLSCMLLLELRLYEPVERGLRIIRLFKLAFEYLSFKSVLFE